MSNHFIPLSQAVDMTALFRAEKENILLPAHRGQNILPVCETFGRDAFDELLAQTDCAAIRVYFSMDAQLKVKLVIVGVNSNKEDILPVSPPGSEKIAEDGQRCPDICPPSSPLNS
jgi:hypothetical protein